MRKKGDNVLDILSSLKFTVVLLLGIAVLCLIGTVFPQVSGEAGRASRLPFLVGPYDIFHSIWFVGAGLLLCVNLVLCMRRRLHLKRRSVLMLLLHGSILLIIVGYAMGAMSLDGFVEIPEGGAVSRVGLKNGSSADLGFTVQCDGFVVDYYDNGMPREYVSDLSFLRDSRVLGTARVKVNHPYRMEGLSFYQESFRQSLSAAVTVSGGQETVTSRVSEGDIIALSPAGTRARVVKIWHDLMHAGPAVKLMIEDAQGERFLWVFQNIEEIRSRVPDLFERMPGFDPSYLKPYTFSCEEVKHSFITGIGVKRDPGVPLVGAGGALFLLSLLLVYLAPRTGPASRPQTSGGNPEPALLKKSPRDDVRGTAKSKGVRP